jgi:ankyrin repeat protein
MMQDDLGNTPLHCACEFNFTELVQTILDAEGDKQTELIATKDRKGYTPLHRCAVRDSVEAGNSTMHSACLMYFFLIEYCI